MRVLVAGADGYIGTQLVPHLAERGHAVTGLDTGFYRAGELFAHPGGAAPLIRKDIREIAEEELRGLDAVVHLAELSNDPLGEINPQITFQINHLGSVRLAELCKHAGVRRFVYTSSCSVYGAGGRGYRKESSEVRPQTAYAECKVRVERDVGALADRGFSPTFLRNATAYGPSPRMRFDLVLNNLAGLAWTTKAIVLASDGTPWRPLVHVSDICEAIACTLEAPREAVHGEIFNVGHSAENYRVREIAAIVSDTFPACALRMGDRGDDHRSYRVSFDKLHERFPEFGCRYDAEAGTRQLLELFERIALTRTTFELPSFTRVRQLRHLLHTKQVDARLFWKTAA